MEDAANELINMLMEFDHNQREEGEKPEEENSPENKMLDHIDSEGTETVIVTVIYITLLLLANIIIVLCKYYANPFARVIIFCM